MTYRLPVDEIVERYKAGENTTALGRVFGVNRRVIARRLRAAGVKVRMGTPGNRNRKKPEGPLFFDHGYLATHDRNHKNVRVHRACWEARRGAIPNGWVVHHDDGDKRNNNIENLECMSWAAHSRLHMLERYSREVI